MGALNSLMRTRRTPDANEARLHSAQHISSHQTVFVEFRDPTEQLNHDILTIKNNATTIDALFVEVDRLFLHVLSASRLVLQPRLKSEIQQLHNKWATHCQEYRDLLWSSRERAGEAQALASDFLQVCLPRLRDNSIELKAKIAELQDYEEAIQRHLSAAQDFSDRCIKLTERVRSVSEQWSSIASLQRWATSKDVLLSTILQRISENLGALSGQYLDSDANSAAYLLRVLSPAFIAKVEEVKSQMHLSESVAGANLNVDTLLAGDGQTNWAHDSNGLVLRLSAISYLCIAIHLDIQRVSQKLQHPSSQIAQTFVKPSLDTIELIYPSLISSLRQYQISVADS